MSQSLVAAFKAVATTKQLQAAKDGMVVWAEGKEQREALLGAGFTMIKKTNKYWHVAYPQSNQLSAELNEHGLACEVIRITDEYDDSMGAYEALHVVDVDGNEFSVNNKYDTTVCFRHMDEESLLTYANK